LEKPYLTKQYHIYRNSYSDIHEHLPTFKRYVDEMDCSHVTELGYRKGISSFGFGVGNCQTLISYDINNPSVFSIDIEERMQKFKEEGVDFRFIIGDSLLIDIEETDLLFIDTWHCYKQLRVELFKHHSKVKKYIMMHDTVSFGNSDEVGYTSSYDYEHVNGVGLLQAINEFLDAHGDEWEMFEHFEYCNGLMVLRRK
jgi:hypothetical protein